MLKKSPLKSTQFNHKLGAMVGFSAKPKSIKKTNFEEMVFCRFQLKKSKNAVKIDSSGHYMNFYRSINTTADLKKNIFPWRL